MRILIIILTFSILSGCATAASKGSILRAESNLNKGDYQDVISIAESSMRAYRSTYTDAQKAEMLFLKAQAYQKLDDLDGFLVTLTYIIEEFPETEHAHRAKYILSDKN